MVIEDDNNIKVSNEPVIELVDEEEKLPDDVEIKEQENLDMSQMIIN